MSNKRKRVALLFAFHNFHISVPQTGMLPWNLNLTQPTSNKIYPVQVSLVLKISSIINLEGIIMISSDFQFYGFINRDDSADCSCEVFMKEKGHAFERGNKTLRIQDQINGACRGGLLPLGWQKWEAYSVKFLPDAQLVSKNFSTNYQ